MSAARRATPTRITRCPTIRDELRYVVRHDLMQNTARDTLTVRNNPTQEALPMRRLGSFLPGEVVGGSGVHWSGHTWRWTDMEFKIRSMYEERYGRNFIPADMTIQDWGITYDELEPYYEKFERIAAVSGKAGNIKGQIQPGGNRFEAPRANEYALPALTPILASLTFERGRKEQGLESVPAPVGQRLARLHQSRKGRNSAPASIAAIASASAAKPTRRAARMSRSFRSRMRNPNFELRTHAWVTKVIKDSSGRRVTGVAYTNLLNGEEFEQPADMVLLCAYAINNVHLMLLSQIGQPYDPVTQRGVIGKNYAYQTGAAANLFFEGKRFNPFMNAGGSNICCDDFNINWDYDRGPGKFIGGFNIGSGFNTVLPIGYRPVPAGTPQWGKEWKAATAKYYQMAMNIGSAGSVMANRYNYYDLDPTYKNAFGLPLMRMTFDYKENEHKMGRVAADLINDVARA